jgi:hypothetical protein
MPSAYQLFVYVFDSEGVFFVLVGVGDGVGVGAFVVGGSVGDWVVGGGEGGVGAVARVSLIVVSRSIVAPACGLWPMTVPEGLALSR